MDRNLLFIFVIAIFSLSSTHAFADACKSGKSQSDQAVAALGPAAAAGAGSMGMGNGLPSSYPAATNPSGGKGAALEQAANACNAAAQSCKKTCDQMAQYYQAQNMMPQAQQARSTGEQCMSQNKPKCDMAAQQAQADKQHQQQGQQAAPSAQPQQQMPQEQQQEPEEEKKYAGCPAGLTKQGEDYDGKPLCGCPAGQKAVATNGGETVDLASQPQGSDVFTADDANKYQCVAIQSEEPEGPTVEQDDTSVQTVNNDTVGGVDGSGDAPQAAYYETKSAIQSNSSGASANAYSWRGLKMRDFEEGEDEEELDEAVDEIAYVPPQLMNVGPHRRVAAIGKTNYLPSSRRSALGPRTKDVGKKDAALAAPIRAPMNVDPEAAAVAKALMDPKAHTNPHIEIDKEGQKIAMLIDSPDPLSLCNVADRIRLLESGGVYATKRAVELRSKFNSRVSRFGGEAGLDMLCTTSDNSF